MPVGLPAAIIVAAGFVGRVVPPIRRLVSLDLSRAGVPARRLRRPSRLLNGHNVNQ
jgi:ABC-type cobalamin transport system permease subunit